MASEKSGVRPHPTLARSLTAEVRLYNYEPSIIESDIHNLSVDDVVVRVAATRPEYVGITLFTAGVCSSAEISRKIKAILLATST